MIRVGNALAPRWYESNPAKLEHLLDRGALRLISCYDFLQTIQQDFEPRRQLAFTAADAPAGDGFQPARGAPLCV